jgi:hypothetical protein
MDEVITNPHGVRPDAPPPVEDIDEDETPEEDWSARPIELSAVAPKRPTANLKTPKNPEGTLYELAVPEDFGDTGLHELSVMQERLDELWAIKKPSETEAKQCARLLNRLTVALIRDVPPEDVAILPPVTKRALVARFFFQTAAGTARVMGVPVEILMKALETES